MDRAGIYIVKLVQGARALQARGHTVGVLARLRAGGPLAWANAIRRRLVPTVRVPSDHAMGYPVFRGPGTIPDVTEVVARFRPDVAVVLPGHPVPMLQRCLALGVPTVLYQQDVLFDELGGVLAPDPRLAVVANSRFTASRLESRFGVHADVFPPFVDAERYRVAPRGREVLFVGLVAMKGVEVAFRIARTLGVGLEEAFGYGDG